MPTLLNRSAVTITPTPRFVDWAQTIAPTSDPEALRKELQEDPSIYLIDEVDFPDPETVQQAIEKSFLEIAMHEFFSWWTCEDDWPVLKSLSEFENYFSWKYHGLVVDVSDDDFILDDLE